MSGTRITSRIARAVVLGTATAALVLGVSSPANAAVGNFAEARMTVTKNNAMPGYHTVGIGGRVSMSQGEAQGLINSGHKITYHLWGEDTFSDDHLLNREALSIQATPQGLVFSSGIGDVESSVLDEDWGRDELYIIVALRKPDGSILRAAETNRVHGYF